MDEVLSDCFPVAYHAETLKKKPPTFCGDREAVEGVPVSQQLKCSKNRSVLPLTADIGYESNEDPFRLLRSHLPQSAMLST